MTSFTLVRSIKLNQLTFTAQEGIQQIATISCSRTQLFGDS